MKKIFTTSIVLLSLLALGGCSQAYTSIMGVGQWNDGKAQCYTHGEGGISCIPLSQLK